MKNTQKYTFRSYYKYTFSVIGEDGKTYFLENDLCNGGDIYRFSLDKEGKMKFIDGHWTIDGLIFESSL